MIYNSHLKQLNDCRGNNIHFRHHQWQKLLAKYQQFFSLELDETLEKAQASNNSHIISKSNHMQIIKQG